MKLSKIFLAGLFICSCFFAFSSVAQAQGIAIDPMLRPQTLPTAVGEESALGNDPENDDKRAALYYKEDTVRAALLGKITNVLLGLAGILAIFAIVNNAWYLIVSAGGEGIDQHKKGLMWAVLGLVLIILSYSIIRFVISIPLSADEPEDTTQESAPTTPEVRPSNSQGSASPINRGRSVEE